MPMRIDPSRTSEAPTTLEQMRERNQALIRAAADYLDMSPKDLRTQLHGGRSLAEITAERGKSVSGLRRALVEADPGATGPGGVHPHVFIDQFIRAEHRRGEGGPARGVLPKLPNEGREPPHIHPVPGPRPQEPPHILPVPEPDQGAKDPPRLHPMPGPTAEDALDTRPRIDKTL